MQDYHLHSEHSMDSEEPMRNVCAAAVAAGLKYIAITDHEERPSPPKFHIKDKAAYLKDIESCRAEFPELNIARGLELDFEEAHWDVLKAYPDLLDLDFVLVSQHWCMGMDTADQRFYKLGDQRFCYETYLKDVLHMLDVINGPYVIGHITYVSKFAPYPDNKLYYAQYSDLLDAILSKIIEKGFGMEINTSGLKNRADTLPSPEVVKRYRELGGEILTIGSDGHSAQRVGDGNAYALEAARNAGFKYLSVFKERKPEFVKI